MGPSVFKNRCSPGPQETEGTLWEYTTTLFCYCMKNWILSLQHPLLLPAPPSPCSSPESLWWFLALSTRYITEQSNPRQAPGSQAAMYMLLRPRQAPILMNTLRTCQSKPDVKCASQLQAGFQMYFTTGLLGQQSWRGLCVCTCVYVHTCVPHSEDNLGCQSTLSIMGFPGMGLWPLRLGNKHILTH